MRNLNIEFYLYTAIFPYIPWNPSTKPYNCHIGFQYSHLAISFNINDNLWRLSCLALLSISNYTQSGTRKKKWTINENVRLIKPNWQLNVIKMYSELFVCGYDNRNIIWSWILQLTCNPPCIRSPFKCPC